MWSLSPPQLVVPVRDVEVINAYGFLKPGSSRVPVVIKNLSARTVTIRKGDAIAEVAPANIIPAMLAPEPSEESSTGLLP